jgi:hypothetical protein
VKELIASNRLVGSCHKKCIAPDDAHRYHEGELLKGEAVCIDRCTSKFFEVSSILFGSEAVTELIYRSTRRSERGCKLWEDRLSRLVRSGDRQDPMSNSRGRE